MSPSSTIHQRLTAIEDLATCEPSLLAEAANLQYTTDGDPGYHRRRCGRGFTYTDEDGKTVRDQELRQRFRDLVIPPAWVEVWIASDCNAHIQATGRDEAGRKQYIYHEQWEIVRDFVKYARLRAFAEALPSVRERVAADLRKRKLSRDKVAALVIRLLGETLIRIGNSQYAQQNNSYGLTTLHDEHAIIEHNEVIFEFRGKSGKEHEVTLHDRRLARLVQACQDLPGQHLFQYYDDEGNVCALGSGDVNSYLRTITDCDFTAKDFRTWGGTVWTAHTLHAAGPSNTESAADQAIVDAIKCAAQELGNTPAVCRAHYVHPAVLESYRDQSLFLLYKEIAPTHVEEKYGLSLDEAVVLHLLMQ